MVGEGTGSSRGCRLVGSRARGSAPRPQVPAGTCSQRPHVSRALGALRSLTCEAQRPGLACRPQPDLTGGGLWARSGISGMTVPRVTAGGRCRSARSVRLSCKMLFTYSFKTHGGGGVRDAGEGQWGPDTAPIPGPGVTPWAEGRRSTAEPPGAPSPYIHK